MISEASVQWWAKEFSLGDEIDPQTKVAQYQQAKANIQKASAEQGTETPGQVIPKLTTYGQALPTANGVQVVNRQGQDARAVKKEVVPVIIQALDSLIQKAQTEKPKKEDPDKSEKDAKKEREGLSPMERAEFEDREELSRTIERVLGVGPEDAMKLIGDLEKTINTPRKGTKVDKFLEILGLKKPELVEGAKQELRDGVQGFFSVMGKVQTTSDGRAYINASDLTSAERDALKILTIRNKGDVFIGRPGEPVEAYKTLQESAMYGDSNYGYSLGKALSQFGNQLKDVRLVGGNLDVTDMPSDEFENLPKAFKGSKSGAGSGNNDAVGKFKEYVTELNWAIASGDKKAISEAREKVKKSLEQFGAIPTDIASLETPLDDEEYDVIEALIEDIEGAGGLSVFARNMVKSAAESVESFNKALGIKQGDVIKVAAPSQKSLMGERPDVIAFIKPEAKINTSAFRKGTTLHVVTPEDTDIIAEYGEEVIGATMVNTSIKVKKEEASTTRCGSGAVAKALGKDTKEYDELRKSSLDRLEAQGVLTKEQRKMADKALARDRAMYQHIEDRLSRLNPTNTKDVISFLQSLDIDDVTISGREKYRQEAKEIADGLKSDDPEVRRLATIKVFQLSKIRRGATSSAGSDYARGAMLNDMVLSFSSKIEEPLVITSPTRNSVGTNHGLQADLVKELFNPKNKVRVDPARTGLTTADGRVLFGLRRVARKGKNPAVEFELGHWAEVSYMSNAS